MFRMLQSLVFLMVSVNISFAQLSQDDWKINLRNDIDLDKEEHPFFESLPREYLVATIDVASIYHDIALESQTIELPNANGGFDRYEIWPIEVVANKNSSTIKTFRGHKANDPNVVLSFSIYKQALYAGIYGGKETQYILPASHHNNTSIIYFSKDELKSTLACGVEDAAVTQEDNRVAHNHSQRSNIMKTYRLAIAATGEYSQHFGGNPYDVQNVRNAITAGINLLNPILERDLNLTFIDVTQNSIIFEDPQTDPYTNLSQGGSTISQNQTVISDAIGNDNYDLGHLVAWINKGGIASMPSACNNSYKSKGFSSSSNSLSVLWIDYVGHEIGHQFGMRHNHSTLNSCNTTNGFRYEPGDGSTIMSYAGLCGNSSQYNTEPYYHISSINSLHNFNFSCGQEVGTISTPVVNPDVSALNIPKSTPFVLTGTGNADQYNWVQYDGSGPGDSSSPTGECTNCANFEYQVPSADTYRHFPNLSDNISQGNDITWEKLSSVARTINFKMVGRTNPGVSFSDVVVNVVNAGPFVITYPNENTILTPGILITSTWTVNGTESIAPTVDIFFSVDGGGTFTLLLGDTPNDGSAEVTLPNTETLVGRLLIQGHVDGSQFRGGSTFYDISDEAIGLGQNPTAAPSNDDEINAQFVDIGLDVEGDLEFATVEADNSVACPDVNNMNVTKDLWYVYTINSGIDNQIFSVDVNFPSGGNYGAEVISPFEQKFCMDQNSNSINLQLNGNQWSGLQFKVRIFAYSVNLRGEELNTRSSEIFTVSTQSSAALPITLESFSGERIGDKVVLKWTTSTEDNVSHFDVLASKDGKDWSSIGDEVAMGNSTQKVSYSYTDYNADNLYFKIRSIDLDGFQSDSEAIYVSVPKASNAFIAYPNPVRDVLKVEIPENSEAIGELQLYDIQGKLVHTQTMKGHTQNSYHIDVSQFESGIYILKYFEQEVITKKIHIL